MSFSSLFSTFSDKWAQFEPKQRTRFLVIGIISVLVLSTLLYIAFRPQYVAVFHGLTLEDAAEVTSALEGSRIPSRLQDAGTSIAVPRQWADQARLEAAAAGLPRSGRVGGYDLFTQSSFGMTESERALQQQLLLEQQLTRTVLKISGVQDATVKLALPKDNVFLDPKRQTTATASVWLKTLNPLDASQVAGIAHLVSRSVPNLSQDNVTVIDADGRVLNSGTNGAPSVGDQQTRQRALQLELERSINSLLGQVFGPENVAVRVVADLDFDQRSTETVRFLAPQDGQSGLVRTIEELTESYSGQDGAAVGQPGTGQNGGGYQTPDAGTGQSVAEKRQRAITYELDEIRETITYAPGAIERLSVSVIVNQAPGAFDAERVREAVQAAIGYDLSRSDVVSVQAMSFAPPEEIPQVSVATPWYSSLPAKIGLGVLLALMAFVLVRAVSRPRPMRVEDLYPAPVAAGVAEQESKPSKVLEMPEDNDEQRMRKHLERIARQKPEDFAVLLRTWLNEEN